MVPVLFCTQTELFGLDLSHVYLVWFFLHRMGSHSFLHSGSFGTAVGSQDLHWAVVLSHFLPLVLVHSVPHLLAVIVQFLSVAGSHAEQMCVSWLHFWCLMFGLQVASQLALGRQVADCAVQLIVHCCVVLLHETSSAALHAGGFPLGPPLRHEALSGKPGSPEVDTLQVGGVLVVSQSNPVQLMVRYWVGQVNRYGLNLL